jgi:hypothetical protein
MIKKMRSAGPCGRPLCEVRSGDRRCSQARLAALESGVKIFVPLPRVGPLGIGPTAGLNDETPFGVFRRGKRKTEGRLVGRVIVPGLPHGAVWLARAPTTTREGARAPRDLERGCANQRHMRLDNILNCCSHGMVA